MDVNSIFMVKDKLLILFELHLFYKEYETSYRPTLIMFKSDLKLLQI